MITLDAAMTVLATALIIGGTFFLAVGSLGIVRLPDFYTRMHAQGKADTLGGMLMVAGLALHSGLQLSALKLLLLLVFIAVANPTATHALSRAAYRSGLPMWSAKKEEP
jgi:multicomponent Na+:H+ antiporter subunit G